MATNEEMRRASGAAMESSRRTSGDAMESSRRASGAAMVERRTGKSVAEDVNALVNPPRQSKSLPKIEPVGALPSRIGTGTYRPSATGGGTGGGIASPLSEEYAVVESAETESGLMLTPKRDYWPDGMTSSDGLFVLPAIKTLNLIDANGNAVQVKLANPSGVPVEPK